VKIYKKPQRAQFFMLDRCPYYGICEAEIRHALGNNEKYCLGSINWEYCSEFNKFELNEGGNERNVELKRLAQEIHKDLQQKRQQPVLLALVSFRGDGLYQDQGWSIEKLELIQNLTRILVPYMDVNEYYLVKNRDNFLFLKIQVDTLLVCMAGTTPEDLLPGLQANLPKYKEMLESYLTTHPLEK
jgi:hypothetical protein